MFREPANAAPEAKPILSKRFLMDPNPESLDLHPFVAHFFPDRIGMVVRSRFCHVDGYGTSPAVKETVRTLLDWDVVARESASVAGCASDSAIHLRFQSESRTGMESETGMPPTLTGCGEAMELDLTFKEAQSTVDDEFLCQDPHMFILDSAKAANSMFTQEFLFGENRLVSKSNSSMTGGIKGSWTLVSGLGQTSHYSENGISRSYSLEEILEVK